MPVKFEGDTVKRLEGLYTDFPENILIDPELNGRHEDTSVEDLASDIETNGQDEPVVVRKNDDGMAVLVFGHRRWRAICLLNERNPQALRKIVFTYQNLSEMEAFMRAIAENRFRRDVSPIDDCANICMMQKRFAQSFEDIAKVYFPEARTKDELAAALKFVKDRADLQELDPTAAQAVRDGRVKLTAAKALAKLTKTQQRAKMAVQGKVKTADVKRYIPEPAKKESARASKKTVAEFIADALIFIDNDEVYLAKSQLVAALKILEGN